MTSVQKEDLVTLTIDGFEVSVPKGTLLIRAAEQIGIQIPRFCDHPLLAPAGACRQCLVEVTDMGNGRGLPKPAASCAQTVAPGMVVKTQLTSAVADKAQQGVMELLLINHPLDCPVCDKGGECPLQNQAMSNGRAESRFHDIKRTFAKPIAISANVLLDRERCVLCQRCTRFSDEIAGDPFIDLLERGRAAADRDVRGHPVPVLFLGQHRADLPGRRTDGSVVPLPRAAVRPDEHRFDLRALRVGCSIRADWRRGKITRRLAGDDPEVNEEWNCDKGRWAFHYATQTDRLQTPLIRNEAGQLVPASWTEAFERAASGLREAVDHGGVGVLPGGRLTEEDAYAYAKFARLALSTNDIDFRSRPSSDEELAFLGSHVAGVTPEHVSYTSLEAAPAVLLVGFEPEEESPIVYLRLHKSTSKGRAKVWSVAAVASGGLTKLGGTLIATVPGAEAMALGALDGAVVDALSADGAVILVGERLASSPGALSAAATLAGSTGAKLAWIPRRAGEVGAIDAGALPTLLPGGRPITNDAARVEVERVWNASVPTGIGRSVDAIIEAAHSGSLSALVVGGLDPADLAAPARLLEALERVGFVVSLEIRESAVTARADVVLPVAPAAEKAGRYVTWEGRRRPFDLTLTNTGTLTDGRVLHALAEELDVDLGLPTVDVARQELLRLGTGTARVSAPSVAAAAPTKATLVLATWPELIDAGRMSDGDDNLAGTAKPARAMLSAATAAAHQISDGDTVSVSTDHGVITVPAVIATAADGVVWLPTNARGSSVRSTLQALAGAAVTIARADAPPVVGLVGGAA